ncbi:AAA family ATPase, partial [Nisaea denitrificans]|uniref:AAA family ATPase n=1 Tax=Nisaea denitrificans TaxID=390877 RepID=UPI000491947A
MVFSFALSKSFSTAAGSLPPNAFFVGAGEGEVEILFESFIPGYVANRLQAAMTLEITRMLDKGWASPEAIDDSIKYGLALRRTTIGALMSGSGYFDYGNMSPDELFRNRDIGLLKLKAAVETAEEAPPSSRRGEGREESSLGRQHLGGPDRNHSQISTCTSHRSTNSRKICFWVKCASALFSGYFPEKVHGDKAAKNWCRQRRGWKLTSGLFGEQHRELTAWLTGRWQQEGPPIAAIQGFPGLGKTAIAEHVLAEISGHPDGMTTVHIDCPEGTATLVDDLVLILAETLNAKGDAEVADDLGKGMNAEGVFRKLLTRPRLIILDEAQRLMSEIEGTPKNKQIGNMLEGLSRAAGHPGRVLLLSSREFGAARWEERADTATLYSLRPKDAQDYLQALLERNGRTDAVPLDRIADVALWLGGNARAINLLVSALRRETLDYLVGLAPEAWEARDREVSPRLLREFETRVLTRAVEQLDKRTETFLRRLAVFRNPVPRKALEAVAMTNIEMEASRDELLARYIIEFRTGFYRVHPIVRDTILQHSEPAQRRNAHKMAGDYFAKAFRSKQMVGEAEKLGARFVEARYHFTLAEAEKDLHDVAGCFEQHLQAQFNFNSPTPTDPKELDQRIALLSALLKERGPHGMEYHLARCILARDSAQSNRLALPHLRRSTGPKSPAPAWVLRIRVEAAVFGSGEAANVAREGIKVVSPTQNLFSLYQAAAEILDRDGKAE